MKWFIVTGLLILFTAQLTAAEYCYWAGSTPYCKGQCPTGFIESGRHNSGDGWRCCIGTKARCCMTTPESASCQWVGNAPFCVNNECPDGHREVARDSSGDGSVCLTGNKILCCNN